MPTQTEQDALRAAFYQVPSKPLAEFNITHDKIYTLTLSTDNIDINFGQLARLSAVPLAAIDRIGGFKCFEDTDLPLQPLSKLYSLQISSDNGIGYVYVPWLNTICQADPESYLCAYWVLTPDSDDAEWCKSKLDSDGGIIKFGISCIPVTLISGAGDMLSGAAGLSANIKTAITDPLSSEIESAIETAAESLRLHNVQNGKDFNDVNNRVTSMSADLDENFYRRSATSSSIEINDLCIELSNNFIKYLNNTLNDEHTNPAYLSTETSSKVELANMFTNLSTTVKNGYMYKYEAYKFNETSSKVELANAFSLKQNNLNINTSINKAGDYTNKDIATVDAIVSYIKDELTTYDAIFQGHFKSLAEVPTNGNSKLYTKGPPNKNDYILVNILESDLNTTGFKDFKDKKDVGIWRMKIVADSWDNNLGKMNWIPEYKVSDSPFTTAQIAAINSGINDAWFKTLSADLISYNEIRRRLVAAYPNITAAFGKLAYLDSITNNITGSGTANHLAVFNGNNTITKLDFVPTKEKWIFELEDGQKVAKYVLVQDTTVT